MLTRISKEVEKLELLMEKSNGIAAVENSLPFSQKLNRVTIESSSSTPRHIPKIMEKYMSVPKLVHNVHSSIIHDSQNAQ